MSRKDWSVDEEQYVLEKYETIDSVREIAKHLGRSLSSVTKKATSLGLSRNQHAAAMDRIRKVLSDVPRPTCELAAALGHTQNSMNDLLSIGNREGVCHIASYEPPKRRGRYRALWVLGSGENASKPFQTKPKAPKALQSFIPFRDVLQIAFWGPHKPLESAADLPARVYQQPMEVSDSLEAA